jgi:undecaprenyl diphosphate synthase
LQENWSRGAAEVAFLMALFHRALEEQLADLNASGVRLRFVGDRGRLPAALQQAVARCGALLGAGPRGGGLL